MRKLKQFVILAIPVCLIASFEPSLVRSASASAFVVGSKVCLPLYKKWKREKGWKAFALNRIRNNHQVCGWSAGHSSKERAISDALMLCRKYEKKKPVFGIPNSCYTYEVKQ